MKSKKLWLVTLFTVLFALIGVLAVACDKGKEPTERTEGPETGVYYYDSDNGDEYLITLNGGDKVTFLVKDANKSGEYSIDGEALTFVFGDKEEDRVSATLKDDVLTLTYENSEIRFLKKITYTITFDTAGGEPVNALSVINGRTVAKPADPVRNGFVFRGWFTSDSYKTMFAFDSQIVTSDITLYARWGEVSDGRTEFTVDFDLGYETAELPSVKTVNGKLTDIVIPEREGYTFCGWWVSMYDEASKLSYRYDENTVFNEDTTLFALWKSDNVASKLATPYVSVNGNTITWEAVSGAETYSLEITGPSGFSKISAPQVAGTVYNADFASAPAGDYEIKVIAKASVSANDSDTAVSYYKNKALARVSHFTVNEASALIFNEVANAEKYYVTVECGNANHNHSMVDNGSSTYYNFANCEMKEGGITFVVTATADGYASSVSRVFVYTRDLAQVTGIKIDEEAEALSWNAVENATSYVVTLKYDGGETETINAGSRTSLSLKNYGSGSITITVVAQAKGYNSSESAGYTYNKTTLPVPKDIRLSGTVLSWNEVEGAVSYEVRIGNRVYSTNSSEYDLADAAEIQWVTADDYKVSVRAIGTTNSAWSDTIDMRYYAMYNTLTYSQNVVRWRYVIGATRYEVRVNGGAIVTVKDGSNYAEVKLTQAGINTISVRFFDEQYSEWAETEVYAYEVTFDSREGAGVASVYVAVGDRISLPETTQNGYVFSGWYNSPSGASGNGAQFTDEFFSESGDIVLYAYWKPQQYKVTLNYGDYGVETPGEGSVYYRQNFAWETPVSTDKSMGFVGWYTAPYGGYRLTDEKGVSLQPWNTIGDSEVYARWSAVLKYEYDKSTGGYAVSKGDGIVSVTEVEIPQKYDNGVNGELYVTVVRGFSSTANLIRITIPDTVKSIETTAFNYCYNLREINVTRVEGNNTAVYTSHDGAVIYYTAPESGEHIGSTIDETEYGEYQLYLFPRGKGGTYIIPDYVTDIRGNVCQSNTLLESITISKNVRYISSNAFNGCTALKTVIFVSNTEEGSELTIDANAFQKCTLLASVTLPAQLSSFDSAAFSGCTSLADINIDPQNPVYASIDGVLCSADMSTLIYFPVARTGSYSIPSKIRTIGPNAFVGSLINSVVIHSGVTTISAAAFSGCKNLATVTFTSPAEGVTVTGITIEGGATYSQGAFYNNTALASIVFEEGSKLVSIGSYAFYNCELLSGTLELPATLTYIGKAAFYKSSYTAIVFKGAEAGTEAAALKIEDGTASTNSAFASMTLLASVKFEEGSNVTEIGAYAFAGKSALIGELVIPATVTRIGKAAFYQCKFTSITFDGVAEGTAAALTIEDGDGTTTGAFASCTAAQTVTFKDGSNVVKIGKYAFSGCTGLQTIEFSEKTSSVGDYAFNSCSGLSQVNFSSGDEMEFGESVFNGCSSLRTIRLGANVKNLSSGIFAGVANLSTIVVDPANTAYAAIDGILYQINENKEPIVLMYCPVGKTSGFSIPDTVTEIAAGVFQNRTALTSIVIGKNVEKIGVAAFSGCTNLTSVTFESGRTRELVIEREAFSKCTALESITIPATVTSIGASAFYNCILSTLIFEDADNADGLPLVLESGSGATTSGSLVAGVFASCAFTEVKLPARLTRIGAYAFINCKSLTALEIPGNVGNGEYESGTAQEIGIGASAFSGCSSLASLTFASGTKDLTIGTNAFMSCSALTTLTLPARLAAARDADGNILYPLGATVANTPYVVFYNYVATIPLSVISVYYPKITSISIDGDNDYFSAYNGILYDGNGTTVLYCPASKEIASISGKASTIAATAFVHAQALRTLSIEEGDGSVEFTIPSATTYSRSIFFQCQWLETVNFPKRLVSIGDYAFYYNSIQNLNFALDSDANLETIGNAAFYMSRNLTSVTLPGSLTSIGYAAFAGSGLQTITFKDGAENAPLVIADGTSTTTYASGLTYNSGYSNSGAFMYCASLETVNLPSHMTTIGQRAFWHCENLTALNFAVDGEGKSTSRVATIKEYAFSCTGLADVSLPNSVTTINDNAFNTNAELVSVTLSCKLTGSFNFAMAFSGCPNIEEINVNDDPNAEEGATPAFTSRDGVLFSGDGKTLMYYSAKKTDTAYVVPQGVTAIAASSFNANPYLQTLTLNDELTSVGTSALYNCSALTTVNVVLGANGGSLGEIGQAAFKKTAIETFTVPNTVTSIGMAAFAQCLSLYELTFESGNNDNALTIADGTTSNGTDKDGAFYSDVQLAKVNLSPRVTAIAARAFYSCSVLSDINLSDVRTIGECAFYSCKLLNNIDITNVTEIGKGAFGYCSGLTAIEIPAGVTTLNKGVFYNCTALSTVTFAERTSNIAVTDASSSTTDGGPFGSCSALTSFTIPATMSELGKGMFTASGLKNITIPATVTTIGTAAFANCASLTEVKFDPRTAALTINAGTGTNVYTTGGAFLGCSALERISLPDLGTATLPAYLFYNCKSLETIELSNDFTAIGQCAFYGCAALKNIPVESTALNSVGASAFYGCANLTEFTFGSSLTAVTASAFEGTGLTSVTIPATVTSIAVSAFANNSALQSVEFAPRTKALTITAGTSNAAGKYGAFMQCVNLKSVTLPSKYLTTIPNLTFAFTGLESVYIPACVTTVGKGAFLSCESLTSVEFEENGSSALTFTAGTTTSTSTTSAANNGAFAFCSALESFEIPARLNQITKYTFYGCTNLATVTFEQGASTNKLTTIGATAFYMSGLETITEIPATVITLEKGAFACLTSLKTVTFADGGTSALTLTAGSSTATSSVSNVASNGVFRGCTELSTVRLPARVATIGKYAFYECSGLTAITFGEGASKLTTVDVAAFDSAGLVSITLPNTVTSVGKGAFRNCTSLETVEFAEGGTEAVTITAGSSASTLSTAGVFSGCTSLTSIALPEKLSEIGAYTFYNCNSLGAISIPNGVENIGNYAFRYCSALQTVTVPGSVKTVGAGAFANCTKLESIEFTSGTEEFGNLVFENCSLLATVIMPDTLTTLGVSNLFYGCQNLTRLEVSGAYTVDDTGDYIVLYGDNGTRLIAFIGSGAYTVPEDVTTIGQYAFGNSGVTSVSFKNPDAVIEGYAFWCAFSLDSVTLPANITEIAQTTFYQCGALTEIVLPATLETIGNGAFAKTGLLEVTIPNSVTAIGTGAFWSCAALETVTFAAGGESSLSVAAGTGFTYSTGGAFEGCTSLSSVTLTERLTVIAGQMFFNCQNLTAIDLSGITEIQVNALALTGLTSVTISDTVTAIGKGAFAGSSLTGLIFAEGEEPLVVADGTKDCTVESPDAANLGAFAGCVELASVTLSSRLTGIAAYMFQACLELKSIELPASITSIGNYAFAYNGLESIDLSNVTALGNYAFANCGSLASVTLSDELTATGTGAFQNCVLLTEIDLSHVTSIGTYSFDGCSALSAVALSQELATVSAYAFRGCASLTQINIPETVTTIGNYAFAGSGLTSVSTGSNFVSFGDSAFEGCAELMSVRLDVNAPMSYLGGSGASGTSTFKDCVKLESITVPYSVIRIGNYTFYNCKSLKAFDTTGLLYNCVIGSYAFAESGIEEFDFSHNNTINSYAFAGTPIRSATFSHTSYTSVSEGIFQNCTQLESVWFMNADKMNSTIGAYAFQGCSSLSSINVYEMNIYAIKEYAFDGCTSLSSITIPAKVVGLWAAGGIGSGCFNGWTSEQTIYLETFAEDEKYGSYWADDWNAGCNARIVWAWSADDISG